MTGRLHIRNGKYCVVISYKDRAGKARQKWVQMDLPEKNNKRKAGQLMQEVISDFTETLQEQTHTKNILQENASQMEISELLKEWLETIKGAVRTNSYLNYLNTANDHVIPYFNALGVLVRDIKPVHIQKYYHAKHSEGLSASTIEKHRTVIRGALVYARDILEIVDTLPSDRAKLPRKETTPPCFYTEK